MPYGAPELLESSPRYLSRAVAAGSAIWVALFLLALAAGAYWTAHPPIIERSEIKMKIGIVPPPPAFKIPNSQRVPPADQILKSKTGAIIPVEDRLIPEEPPGPPPEERGD